MPSFDISSTLDWQELDNAVHQATQEVSQRFDFKGVRIEISVDRKEKTVVLWCSESEKWDALNDVFQNKLIKRGLSLLSFEYQPAEDAFGGSLRRKVKVQPGVSVEKGKEIIALLKLSKLKVQGQMQDEQVRVMGKNRDDLQSAISFLKERQNTIPVAMKFGNFRD